MNKTRHVTFRCTPEQYADIQQKAKKLDQSVSAYVVDRLCPEDFNKVLKRIRAREITDRVFK